MVSVASFKSSSTQHDVHLVNYGPVYFKIDHKAENVSGQDYLIKSLLGVGCSLSLVRTFSFQTVVL